MDLWKENRGKRTLRKNGNLPSLYLYLSFRLFLCGKGRSKKWKGKKKHIHNFGYIFFFGLLETTKRNRSGRKRQKKKRKTRWKIVAPNTNFTKYLRSCILGLWCPERRWSFSQWKVFVFSSSLSSPFVCVIQWERIRLLDAMLILHWSCNPHCLLPLATKEEFGWQSTRENK